MLGFFRRFARAVRAVVRALERQEARRASYRDYLARVKREGHGAP